MLGTDLLESSSVEEDLGVLVDNRMTMGQQCALVAKKASGLLGHVKKSVASRLRGGHPPPLLCPGEAASRILCQVLDHRFKKDRELLDRVQQRATKMIKGT
ncbi:hypothetical protein llap_13181 [Limosa lapponica baueri]|uniref:Uncharacterized protein n=1 Tax=Limosa lapponica baueri TaxID=1758121 RepID=A0A2I0TRU6_LIMLA|nr:hypothetical protein llap_13181 [Limosa lapponica baueri]